MRMKKALDSLSFLFSLLVSIFVLQASICRGAPSRRPSDTYDQRQDGKLNVHAKLDNFLIVVAPSWSAGSTDLGDLFEKGLLVSQQALEFKDVASRLAGSGRNVEDEENDESMIVKVEEDEPEGPASRPDAIPPSKASHGIHEQGTAGRSNDMSHVKLETIATDEKNLPVDLETSEQLSEPAEDTKIHDEPPTELETVAADFNGGKLKKKPASRALKDLADRTSISKLPYGENGGPWNVESTKIIDKNANDVAEAQELKLLGDGIENCGPERYRDRLGVCRFRVAPV